MILPSDAASTFEFIYKDGPTIIVGYVDADDMEQAYWKVREHMGADQEWGFLADVALIPV